MSFAYNASAVALGGRIVLPSQTTIFSQASAALVPTGGEGKDTVRNFDYNGIVTFDEASVYVTGSQNGDVFNTLSTVSIRNLNVLNVLHVDFMVGSITSRHEKGKEEGDITFQGTSVDNLRIAGKRVDPRFNHGLYARYPTHAALNTMLKGNVKGSDCPDVASWIEEEVAKERVRGGSSFDEKACRTELGSGKVAGVLAKRFCWDPAAVNANPPEDRGHIHCSLADDIPEIDELTRADEELNPEQLRQLHPIRRKGYVITVAGFGTIKLAEVIIKPGERRLNMFRLELGSPTTGDMTVGSATTNGTELVP
jgi:hypothetical protein